MLACALLGKTEERERKARAGRDILFRMLGIRLGYKDDEVTSVSKSGKRRLDADPRKNSGDNGEGEGHGAKHFIKGMKLLAREIIREEQKTQKPEIKQKGPRDMFLVPE